MDTQDTQGSVLDKVLLLDRLESGLQSALAWTQAHLLTIDVGIQLGLLIAALVPAALFGPRLSRFVETRLGRFATRGVAYRGVQALSVLATPIALYATLTLIRVALGSTGHPTAWVGGAIALMNAWIVVRLVTLVIRSAFWSRFAFYVAWPVAALDAFGALGPVIEQMRELALPLGRN